MERIVQVLADWENKFYGVQRSALKMLPAALAELDARLQKILTQVLRKETHLAASGLKAESVHVVVQQQRVSDVAGRPLRLAAETKSLASGAKPTDAARTGKKQAAPAEVSLPAKAQVGERAELGIRPNVERQEVSEIDEILPAPHSSLEPEKSMAWRFLVTIPWILYAADTDYRTLRQAVLSYAA